MRRKYYNFVPYMPLPAFQKKLIIVRDNPVQFRLLEKGDGEAMHIFITENIERFRSPFPKTTTDVVKGEKESRKWVRAKLLNFKTKSSLILLGMEKNRIVFWGSAFNFEWKVPKCEIAYMVDRRWEGKGLGTEGCRQLMSYLWNKCKLEKILCRVDPRNKGSMALAQKLGFEKEGLLRNDFRNGDGELIDTVYMGHVKRET